MSKSKIMLAMMLAAATAGVMAYSPYGQAAHDQMQHQKAPAQTIEMAVTPEGFVPAQVKVKAGQSVKLVVTRQTDRTCATDIVIKDFGINKSLPLNKPVEVTFTPTKPGKFRYACAMDMISGVLVVE